MINIYSKLLEEAKRSPLLLSDLAGLEEYIAESYNNRSFIELLQNADDAGSSAFLVTIHGQYLIIANDGRPFNSNDVESLCRSAASTKVRGKSIGYRGIGFKSVVSIAKEVHLISGEYEITFSRELTKKMIPNAKKVPLIRIPHPINSSVKNELFRDVEVLKKIGYTTIFVFSGVDITNISEEYSAFQQTSLLFLRNIHTLSVKLNSVVEASIETFYNNDESKDCHICINGTNSDWRIYTNNKCDFAFSIKDKNIVRLNQQEAHIHAFLPTEDNSGLGVIINGDFSTDPSRRHIIYDELSKNVIEEIASLYFKLIEKNIGGQDANSANLIKALMPYFDLRMINFTNNNFGKTFATALKNVDNSIIKTLIVSPIWFNPSDYYKISKFQIRINEQCASVDGFAAILKFLGCQQANINEILIEIKNNQTNEISLLGYSQIAAEGIRKITLNNVIPEFVDAPIFFSKNRRMALNAINKEKTTIDKSYLQLLIDKGITKNDIRICLKKLSLNNLISSTFTDIIDKENTKKAIQGVSANEKRETDTIEKLEDEDNDIKKGHWFNSVNNTNSLQFSNGKKWRSAEENALLVLNANGFDLHDVGSQNLGYDLEGLDPNKNHIYIEIKSLDYRGQKFKMTNNEYAVAQYKQDQYYLALLLQFDDRIEIAFIKNPIKNLCLNRQCVQWVWECQTYSFNPITFTI